MKMKGVKSASPFRNITNLNKKPKQLDEYLKAEQSSIKSYNFEKLEPLKLRENVHKKINLKNPRERSTSSGARLKELCPEDKAKIGELVKKLA